MKWLPILLAVAIIIGNAVVVIYGAKERDLLRARLSQQQYQLEVLVCRFNNKQPGETAELLEDGTVSYWSGR